jgi:branched-subunit amino acid transport protein AzlD
MLVIYVGIVGIPMCHIFPCIILVTQDLGRILESFTSCLACQVRG